MQNIVLVIHLILALCLIVTVLLQRSEGGGLGIGGGGGNMSGRPPASPMTKFTWALAVAFIATSLTLVILANNDAANDSVLQRSGDVTSEPAADPANPLGGDLLPPTSSDAPAAPPKPEE